MVSPDSDERGFDALKAFMKLKAGFDCDRYKERPLKRRIAVRMRAQGIRSYTSYRDLLIEDPQEVSNLLSVLTINLTSFFRNPDMYYALKEKVLKQLIFDRREDGQAALRIWSAGCSSGEEPYSVAILLRELLGASYDGFEVRIWGTDFDERSIERAKSGLYSEASLSEMESSLRDKYFTRNGGYQISPEIKGVCEFFQRDLLSTESHLTALDLVLCRNVLIYFSRDFQDRVFTDFSNRLRGGGYLVLGKVEILMGRARELFESIDNKERIYKKIR